MVQKVNSLLTIVLTCAVASTALAGEKEFTDPAKAQDAPDFAVQGEYVGQGVLPAGSKQKVGAQVIALGDGTFQVFVLEGGLPGAGWKRGDDRFLMDGKRQGDVVTLSGPKGSGRITDGKLTITDPDGHPTMQLKRIERKSPTLGAKPPEGAVVLFNGSGVDSFHDARMNEQKNLINGATTKQQFGSYMLHIEFCLTYIPHARGQARSNSGVFLQDCYEIQVLDSFGLEGRKNECGAYYGVKEPDVNMCLPPLVWQTYDVDFTAPKYDPTGKKVANGQMMVRHNGVVIHDDIEVPRSTWPSEKAEAPGLRPIYLQGHCPGHAHYRNIWLVQKK